MKVQRIGSFAFPAADRHFQQFDCDNYQRELYEQGMSRVKRKKVAVDVGAHVGLWTRRFAREFDSVYAFEPQWENFLCLARNVAGVTASVFVCQTGLGEKSGSGNLVNPAPTNSGAWEMREGEGIPIRPLDSFNLCPGLIKIDVQGYEGRVLKGAMDTILRWSPVLIVENNGDVKEWIGWFPRYTAIELGKNVVAWC